MSFCSFSMSQANTASKWFTAMWTCIVVQFQSLLWNLMASMLGVCLFCDLLLGELAIKGDHDSWQLGCEYKKDYFPQYLFFAILCGEGCLCFVCAITIQFTHSRSNESITIDIILTIFGKVVSLAPMPSCIIWSDYLPLSLFALLIGCISSNCHATCHDMVSLGALHDSHSCCSCKGRWCPHPRGW